VSIATAIEVTAIAIHAAVRRRFGGSTTRGGSSGFGARDAATLSVIVSVAFFARD
jgi:hypothetical protein